MDKKTIFILAAALIISVVGGYLSGSRSVNEVDIASRVVALITENINTQISQGMAKIGSQTSLDYLGVKQLEINGVSEFVKEWSIDSATSTYEWDNTVGHTLFVDLFTWTLSGVPSSTYVAFVGTSTRGFIPSEWSNVYPLRNVNSLISNLIIATSSAATSTSNTLLQGVGSPATTTSSFMIPVKHGETLRVLMMQRFAGLCNASVGTAGTNCESATSTARGFNVNGFFHAWATTTIQFPASAL